MSDPAGIAAGHRLTAAVGRDVLADGGTAADAAVAAAFVAMVAEPVLAGLYGGGFALVRPVSVAARLLDFFVATPGRRLPEGDRDFREVTADFGTATQAFHIGAASIAVPGVVPGLTDLHTRFGRMPWRELLLPAARIAAEGVAMTAFQARLGTIVTPILSASEAARAIWCDSDGAPLGEGATLRNPDLAAVLDAMAHEGPELATRGEVAARLADLASRGGHLTRSDLDRYATRWRTPATARRGPASLATNPVPALGGALVTAALDLCPADPDPVTLAAAFAATVRARMASGIDRDVETGAERLADPAFLRAQAARPRSTRGTTQISVIDGAGLGVSLTLSNGEGCGLVVPGTGIMANNMLGEEDLLPLGWDAWTPGTRLASMMAPTAVAWPDGRVVMLGSGGSNRIRTALAQVLINRIDREMPLGDAIAAPRLHVEGETPPRLDAEDALSERDRAALVAAWPEATLWPERSMFFGGVHAVERNARGGIDAAADPRRDGVALRTGPGGAG